MRYKEIITEVGNATLLVDNLRKNLEVAANSGVASNLEGIDAVVRLGYLGKHSPESIVKSFGIMDPWDPLTDRAVGSYNAATDELATVYRRLMDPSSRLDTATTVAHELRHRAFRLISELPELNNLMPSDLRTKWKDGYGKFNDGNYRDNIDASPEHAMIYSVQEPDLDNSRRSRFLKHPKLGGRKAQYWADLYNEVNNTVKEYIKEKLNKPTTGELPGGELSTPKDQNRNFRLEPWVEEYYTAWDVLKSTGTLRSIKNLGRAVSNYRWYAVGTAGDMKAIYDPAKKVTDLMSKGHFKDISKGIETLLNNRYKWQYQPPRMLHGVRLSGSYATQEMWNEAVDNVEKYFDQVTQDIGSDWSTLDVRYYDGTFVRSLAPLVKKPKPAVVPVEPVTDPEKPTEPPVPRPKSGSMSFKQFAQQTINKSTGKPYWEDIIKSTSKETMETWLMVVSSKTWVANLKIDPATKKHMDTLIVAWPALVPEVRSTVADVFLSQVMLVKF